jgi:hypothetical protein
MYSETGKKSANIRNLHGLAWRRLDAFWLVGSGRKETAAGANFQMIE